MILKIYFYYIGLSCIFPMLLPLCPIYPSTQLQLLEGRKVSPFFLYYIFYITRAVSFYQICTSNKDKSLKGCSVYGLGGGYMYIYTHFQKIDGQWNWKIIMCGIYGLSYIIFLDYISYRVNQQEAFLWMKAEKESIQKHYVSAYRL